MNSSETKSARAAKIREELQRTGKSFQSASVEIAERQGYGYFATFPELATDTRYMGRPEKRIEREFAGFLSRIHYDRRLFSQEMSQAIDDFVLAINRKEANKS